MSIQKVDILCGLNWGDESKGKIAGWLVNTNHYDFVCRWAGGNNAGHTIYVNNKKYKTHIIPCGVFYNVKSIIGHDCVVNIEGFKEEIQYLENNGFDTSLIKISPKAHVVMDKHIEEDKKDYAEKQGTTSRGIAPCYKEKYGRTGTRVEDVDFFKPYLWDEQLYGNVLCEGAQGFWLDINYGNYPYVTSSTTLPYGACVLGFPPQKIEKIIGATKMYDTRSGKDPLFPESLLEDEELKQLCILGEEYGTTTGRLRKVNWLNMDKLIKAINISGVTDIVISKVDVIEKMNVFKIITNDKITKFNSLETMKLFIKKKLEIECPLLNNILFSGLKEGI